MRRESVRGSMRRVVRAELGAERRRQAREVLAARADDIFSRAELGARADFAQARAVFEELRTELPE